MADNTAKSFKVPKIRKDNKDGLREIDVNGRDAQDIKNIVQRSYIENGYKSQWHLKAVQYVRNRELEERYRLKRAEMKDEGRNARDLGEQYTYLLFRDTAMVPAICKEGLKCRSLPFNALGNSKLGLYLSRNADIQLRLAENWQMNMCVMVIFKITPGKCKVLISGSDGGEDMEPTPNYDCHVSQYQPRSCDPIHLQLARSQIYLYEYTEDCEPSDCPRHCLPYAVLTYQKSENKSQSTQAQSDSYSKRPTVADRSRPEKGSSDSCSDLLNKVVDTLNVTDPRLSKNDPRRASIDTQLNPQDPRTSLVTGQGGETGLCVPRLTAGPEAGLCVPRLTAGPPPGTASSAPTPTTVSSRDPRAQSGSAYRPSFGPEFESDNNELLQSLIQNQLEQQQQLAFQTNQNPPAMHPNDPRLRRNDPRTRSDPRLDPRKDPRAESRVDPRLDPRLNQRSDPRIEPRSDPRLEPRSDPRLDPSLDPSTDPRLDPIISNPRIRRTGSQSVSNTSVSKSKSIYSDNPSLRKKMSISDYKQKVGIQPVVKAVDSQESQGDDEEYDPTAVSDYKQTVRAARIDQQKDARTSQDGLVDNSDDMKKALDELSDPEGSPSHKASPPHEESPSHMAMLEEVAAEDPGLAEAMRKLVEHAGDMSLFTEALSKLQESAEELGDALHDPAFLVKAIAENVESLKKAKSMEIDTNDDDNANDNSDVVGSKASRSETEVPSTKQSQYQLIENKPEVASEESAMEQAMKNTLEEFHKTEQVVTQSSSSFTGQVFSYAQNEPNRDPKVLDLVDVSSIPIPDYSPKKPRQVDNSVQSPLNTDLQNIPLPENSPLKKRNTGVSDNKTNKDVSDNDINNDFTVNQTNKSISLSVDKTDEKTAKVFDNEGEKEDILEIKDKDERLTSKSAIDISKVSHSDSDEDHRTIQPDVPSFKPYLEIVDQDYRLQERNKYLGFVIDTESKAKMSYDISHSGLEMMKHSESLNSLADTDERVNLDVDEIKDRDDRVVTSNSVNGVSEVQDKDERHVVEDKALSLETTNVIMDKDERILPSKSQKDLSSMSFEDPSFLDKDERRSHSRSQSPPNRTTVSNMDTTRAVTYIDISDSSSNVHINRLGSDIDLDRIRSRSASPSSVTEDTEDVKIIPLHNLDDSQSSADSVMFDAYNLGGKDTTGQNNEGVENEFGDVDWRLAAEAAEMGDIDLRASKSATSKSSSSSVSLSQENVPATQTEASRIDVSASQSSLSQDSADIDLRGSATSLSESNTDVGGSNIDLREIKGSNIDLRASSTDLNDSNKDLEIKSSNIDLRASSTSLGDSNIAISDPVSERQFDSPDPRSMREPNISAMSSPNQNLSVHNPQIMLPQANFQSFHYTSNMQPMFGQPMNIMQPAGGFVINPPRLVPFVTYRAPIPSFNAPMNFGGEYRSGRFQERAYRDPYSYSTGGSGIEQCPNRNMNQAGPPIRHPNQAGPPLRHPNQAGPQGPPGPGGMHNLMNRVDFSNLKNILAAVHVPGPGMAPGDPRGAPGPFPGAGPQPGGDVGNVNLDSDEERENQPAFCTGLSFLKTKSPNKKEKKRTKYTGLAKGMETGLDEMLDQSESTPTLPGLGPVSRQDDALPELIPGLSSGGIPGLEASPESPTSAGNADKPFTFSQDIPDRDISSEWYEGSPTKDTKISDKSESKSKSPKKKSKRKRNESRNSDNDDCWQDAFFDIRGESPTLDEQNDGNKDDVTVTQTSELSTDNTGVVVEKEVVNLNQDGKRALDFTDEEASVKKMKTEVTTTTTLEFGDDDDSDDENGLVIDLDSSSVKPSESGETVITIEDDTSNDKIDMPGRSATPVQDEPTSGQATPVLDETMEGRHTPVQDENTEDKEAESGDNDGVEILEDEPVGTPTNKSEMKKFIEKKRKNIVIKLKGETKIVDVKTGKAYNDNIVGSAIEVLGQPKKPPQNVQQPLPRPAVQKPVKKEFKGASISTLIDRKAIPNYSNRYSRDQEPMKEYTHPYTGQKMVYPIQPVSTAQSATPQTVLSIPTIGSQTNNQPARGQASNQTKLAISDNCRKRNTADKPDIVSDPKRVKVEQNNTVIKVLTDPSQTEPSVSGSKQESKSDPSQGEPSTADNTQDTNKTEGDGESELEDGEISDDDDNADDKPVKKERKKHSRKSGERRHKRKHREKSRYKHDDYDEYNDYDDYDDYDEYGYSKHDDYEYSRRREYDYDSDYGRDSDIRPHKAGSDWSELLQSTKKEQIERIPNRAGSSTEFSEEENKLLSNSAAKFIKAKQRMLAKTQMKTLGDWLKVELEIDNIEPLQNILQYSLDTDLSVIPKPKRRKIRMKVKSVIEEEGKKQSAVGTNRYDSYAGEEMFDSPEVSHEQIERELGMVKDVRQTLYRPMEFRRKNPLRLHHKPLIPGSYEEIALQGALGTVEMCMDALLGRTNYFGYPNRRVPQDLLFDEETSSLKSVCGTLFLILVSPISLKSQKKLSLLKDVYKKLCKQKESASVPKTIDTEIESLLVQRQNMLRPFTGYLNKKRINKLQEQSDAFKMVYDFYKTQVPPFPDSAIMYIKTTWQDLQQHLILAKQYLTAEEKKV